MPTPADRILNYVHRIASQPGPERNDCELLARFLADRDPAAFETLVARHGSMVLRVCQHVLGNQHDAEDAFQATFLVLSRKAASVRPDACLASWLHGVACRVALGARSAARRRRREDLSPDVAPPDPRPDLLAELTARETLRILEEEVQRLPEMYRLPVTLCCLHGLTQEEVARQLGWTPGSVKGRLERGRKRLHRRLAGRGLGLATALALVEVSRATAVGLGEKLAASTAMAAAALASGRITGTGLVSAQVLALFKGGLTQMALAKVKLGLVLLLATGALAAGLAAVGRPLPARQLSEARAAAQSGQSAKPPIDKAPARTDRSGDPLPIGALARLGSARLNQGAGVVDLAFSPNGKLVASCGESAGDDRAIYLWDVATGKLVVRIQGDEHVRKLSFSPDGKLLASSGRRITVRLWNVATGKEQCRCGDKTRLVSDLAFSPDGNRLACIFSEGAADSVMLWDTATGKEIRSWKVKDQETWSIAFSPDGATLATAGQQNSLRLWDVATGTEQRRIEVDQVKKYGRPLDFSPDGKRVALANDLHTIRLWDTGTGKELLPLRGHKGQIKRLAFSRGGKTLVSASKDGTIRFWDTTTAKEQHVATISGDIWECWVMAFSPDAKVLAAGWGTNTIRLFDVATGQPLQTRDGHTGPVTAVGFLPAGDLTASIGWGGGVVLSETATGKERHRSKRGPDYRLSMVVSQQWGDRLLLCPAALSRDGSLAVLPGDADKNDKATIIILDSLSGREVDSFTGDFGSVLCLDISPDKKTLALACDDKTIRVWDRAARKEVRRLTGNRGDVFAVEISPDGKLVASGCDDQTVRVWELSTGKEVHILRHGVRVHAVAFAPDGRSLASAGGEHLGDKGGDTGVCLWELATGQERGRLRGNHHLVTCLAFVPDGKFLALGSSDGTVRVWDPMIGKELRCFEGHRGVVHSLAFSRDGKHLMSGGADTTVLIWDATGLAAPPPSAASLKPAQREALWSDLAGADARRAYRAMRPLLTDRKEIVGFLKNRLRPVLSTDSRQIARWVADLDAEEFVVRENATAALAKQGELTESALRRALAGRPSLELQRRAETLLAARTPGASPEQLRALRAVEVLEHLATPEARTLLTALGRGAPQGRLTREATAALDRLKARP